MGVGWFWGGPDAGADATIAVLLLLGLIVYDARSANSLFLDNLRLQITSIGVATLIAAIVAVFFGGAYMDTRFSASRQDLDLRLAHWNHVAHLLRTPDDWLFGKGLGRFPSTYFYSVDNSDFPGSFRLEEGDGKRYLVLSGPRHPTGFGELFRVSQRVPSIPHVNYTVTLDAMVARDVALHFEICEKHLLYPAGCATQSVAMKANPISWQRVVVPLDGHEIGTRRASGSKSTTWLFAPSTVPT